MVMQQLRGFKTFDASSPDRLFIGGSSHVKAKGVYTYTDAPAKSDPAAQKFIAVRRMTGKSHRRAHAEGYVVPGVCVCRGPVPWI